MGSGPPPSQKIYEALVYFASPLKQLTYPNSSMDLAGLSRENHVQSYLLLFLHFASFDCDCWIMRRDALFSLYSLAVATSPAVELASYCRLDIGRRAQGS